MTKTVFDASRLHVSLPYRLLEEKADFLLSHRLQPEIAFKGSDFDEWAIFDDIPRWGTEFQRAGLAVTVHAPFMDLNPGAVEPLVREATATRIRQALEAAAALKAVRLVVHPGYDRWRYGGNDDLWVEQCLEFWPGFIERAAESGVVLAVENVFEDGPHSLEKLFAALRSPFFGHCFDVGHWHLFCRERIALKDWFERLGPRLVHLHLHDNFGAGDDHLPPGEGLIPFDDVFELATRHAPQATLTLEVPDSEGLQRALVHMQSYVSGIRP